tara:strand:+ start:776 stop:1276 length:501 start_codon:yes stop_codon:yes gene_type:complete
MLDCELIDNHSFSDNRGSFKKVFEIDKVKNQTFSLEECFYSVSKKNVIRGMHWQKRPYEHNKIVFVISGKILDVVLCIDKDNLNFGKYIALELSDMENKSLFIPKGYAHGFLSLEDNTSVVYLTDKKHSAKHDSGIRYDSFSYDWPVRNPIVSERDLAHPAFKLYG